jgi:hypothetical protein
MNKAPQLASPGSTQSASPASAPAREPRAFSFLKPRLITVTPPAIDPHGRAILMARADSSVPALVRAVVDHTIALHNEHGRESGYVQAIQLSVLNRRRRAARAWIQSILSGAVDAPTLHAVATQWLPTLAGNGRDAEFVTRTVRSCVEFVRGSITAVLFDQPEDNLLGNARALHVLETVLSVHLSAAEEARS